jgi:hypothetical protein
MSRNIAEISAKLVKVIRTRDASRVRHIADVLERQKNASLAMEVFAQINHLLEDTDRDLQQWFQDIYFEGCSPDVKALWLECLALKYGLSGTQKAV